MANPPQIRLPQNNRFRPMAEHPLLHDGRMPEKLHPQETLEHPQVPQNRSLFQILEPLNHADNDLRTKSVSMVILYFLHYS